MNRLFNDKKILVKKVLNTKQDNNNNTRLSRKRKEKKKKKEKEKKGVQKKKKKKKKRKKRKKKKEKKKGKRKRGNGNPLYFEPGKPVCKLLAQLPLSCHINHKVLIHINTIITMRGTQELIFLFWAKKTSIVFSLHFGPVRVLQIL